MNCMFMSIDFMHVMNKYAVFWKDLKLTSIDDILAAAGVRIEDYKISKQSRNLLRKDINDIFSNAINATVHPLGLTPQMRALVRQR